MLVPAQQRIAQNLDYRSRDRKACTYQLIILLKKREGNQWLTSTNFLQVAVWLNRAACGCKLWDFEIGYHSQN
ncbi:hypothetical protein BKM16_27440 [Pseudomonas amygdali pv. morsprunorum]|nr:hypothetical protein BKM16_27440 [Pseudomonas amygdali pv. morsprunorum]